MELIEKYYTRWITNFLEMAQKNDWVLLEGVLNFCLQEPHMVATVLGILFLSILLLKLPFLRLANFFIRLYLWMMIKVAPRQVTLRKIKEAMKNTRDNVMQQSELQLNPAYKESYQQELYEILTPPENYYINLAKLGVRKRFEACQDLKENINDSRLFSIRDTHNDEFDNQQMVYHTGEFLPIYQQLREDFVRLGFEQGSVYHTKIFNDIYLTPFFKQGICGYITHTSSTSQFGMIALMDNASRGLSLTTESMDKHVPRPENYPLILMDKKIRVDEGVKKFMEVLKRNPYHHRITPISDANFAEYYEEFHQEFYGFLKSLSLFELKGENT